MKSISNFFNTIAGIFRILVTMAFLWGLVFTLFVDRNLLTSFYDLLGFDAIAPEIIKMITTLIFAFAFFINQLVARRIFKSNKTGQYHMFNMIFGFIFLLLDIGIYFFTRDSLMLYIFAFSLILILGSMFGLGAKAKGLYPVVEINPEGEVEPKIVEEISEEEEERTPLADRKVKQTDLTNDASDSEEDLEDDQVATYDSKDLEELEKEADQKDDTNESIENKEANKENQEETEEEKETFKDQTDSENEDEKESKDEKTEENKEEK